MKSIVNNAKTVKKQIEYPCLMIGTVCDINNVVLFIAHGEGMVVDKGEGKYEVGHYSAKWSMDAFTPFTGSVTLEND